MKPENQKQKIERKIFREKEKNYDKMKLWAN